MDLGLALEVHDVDFRRGREEFIYSNALGQRQHWVAARVFGQFV
jgi:hypothetical protein